MFSGCSLGRWWRNRNSAKALGLLSGLLFGLLITIFGFWKALVIATFSALGFVLGVLVDANPEIKGALGKLFGIRDDDGEDE